MQESQKKQSFNNKKLINSTTLQKDKPYYPTQQQALSYHISKQYHQQNRMSNAHSSKVQSSSRNNYHQQQQSIEDSSYFQTKTISINLNQLAHSSSQTSLKSAQQMRTGKQELEQVAANAKKLKTSFRENSNVNKVQTARSRKSPSPQKIMYNLDTSRQYQSIANEKISNNRNVISRSKKSIDSKMSNSRLSSRIVSSKKEATVIPPQAQIHSLQQQQASFKTTVSSVTNQQNIKSRLSIQNAIQQPKITHRPSTATMNQIQSSQQQLQQQQAQSSSIMNSFDNKKIMKGTNAIHSIEKNRQKKRISDMGSPALKTQQSPRLTLGGASNNGTTSVYSVTTESIINQSGSNTTNNQRKMCLSEKLAPKGKKKRANVNKQPKQITITRDQIILQPFLSIYSTQNGGFSGLGSGQNSNFNTNQDYPRIELNVNPNINNSMQSNVQMQMLESKHNVESTPMTNNLDLLSDDQDFMSTYNRNISQQNLHMTQQKSQSNMFSFNADTGAHTTNNKADTMSEYYNKNLISEFDQQQLAQKYTKTLMSEESKEVTGIFGGQLVETLGNEGNHTHGRPSIDANERKTSSKDVHTPVFHHHQDQSSKRVSDIVLQLDIKLCDDSPMMIQQRESLIQNQTDTQQNQIQSKQSSSSKNCIPQTAPSGQKQDTTTVQSNIQIEDFESEVTHSMHNQSMKKINSTSNLELSRGNISVAQTSILQRNDSNGSFFSRIKNYFGGKPQSQIIDLRRQDVEYRCRCGQSGKSYACQRAIKWLSFANNYSEMEYEKNRQLYLGLLKFNTASGSETQIERDIPRTFPNTDPYMSTTEGQQKLSRVLNAFSKYFNSIGYVQGMNFIVGALLMHCSEDISFWLFVSLIEDYEMRDIYQPKLPGLYKHSQVLQLLQMEHLEKLYYHFSNQNILIEMYASDWIFALFSNIIPITEYHHFLDQFFVGGWTFFYKFSLTFLKCHQDEVISQYDLSEILNMIKLKNIKKDLNDNKSPRIRFDESGQISELESMKRYSDTSSVSPTRQTNSVTRRGLFSRMFGKEAPITSESFKDDAIWERVINQSCTEWENEFNDNFVNQLLSSFDPEKLVFNSSFPNTPKEVSVVYSAHKQSKIDFPIDQSPPKQQKVIEKRQQNQKPPGIQKKQQKEPKMQIKVNESGIRNPRQANLVFTDSHRSSVHSKQNRSQQPRDYKHRQQQQAKRIAP